MCRVLAVSASGYYAWLKRPPSARARADVELTARIRAIHQYSHETYGAPRIHQELRAADIHAACKRVTRLMKAASLRGASRPWMVTTVRDRHARPTPGQRFAHPLEATPAAKGLHRAPRYKQWLLNNYLG